MSIKNKKTENSIIDAIKSVLQNYFPNKLLLTPSIKEYVFTIYFGMLENFLHTLKLNCVKVSKICMKWGKRKKQREESHKEIIKRYHTSR